MPISREEASRTVIARNLDTNTDEYDVIDYFSFCGEVERVEFRKDQNSTSTKTALIVFDYSNSVEQSLLLQDAEVDGRRLRIFSYSKFLEKKQKRRQEQQQRLEAAEGSGDISETVEQTKARLRNYYHQAKQHETVKSTLSMMKQGWSTLTEEANKLVRENQDIPDRIRRSASRASPSARRNRSSPSHSAAVSSASRGSGALMEFGDPFQDQQLQGASAQHNTHQSDGQVEAAKDDGDSLLQLEAESGHGTQHDGVDLLNWDTSGSQQQHTEPEQQHDPSDILIPGFGEAQPAASTVDVDNDVNNDMLDLNTADSNQISSQKANVDTEATDDFLVFQNDPSQNQETTDTADNVLFNESGGANNHSSNQPSAQEADDFDWFAQGDSYQPQQAKTYQQESDGNHEPLMDFGEFSIGVTSPSSANAEKEHTNTNNTKHENLLQGFGDNKQAFKPSKPSMDTLKSTVDTEDLFGDFLQHNDRSDVSDSYNHHNNTQDDPLNTFFSTSSTPPASAQKNHDLADELFIGDKHNLHPKKGKEAKNGGDLVAWGDERDAAIQPYALDTETLSSGSQKNTTLDPDELFGMFSSETTSRSEYSSDSADMPITSQYQQNMDNGDLLGGMTSQFSAFGIGGTPTSRSILELSNSVHARILQFACSSGFEILMFSLISRHFYRILSKMGDKPWQQVCVKQYSVKTLPPGMKTWKEVYRALCAVEMMPNLVPHIRAQVHPNFENSILGLPLDFVVPRFDMVIPKSHVEAVMYGKHPDHQHQSAMFVNMDNDMLCFVRRCPHLEASILRVQQLPNGDFRVFEGRVRAEMAGGLQADALASDAWFFSTETWEKIRSCFLANTPDLHIAQTISVTSVTPNKISFGIRVHLQPGRGAISKVDQNSYSITASIPPALTDDDALNLCHSILDAAVKLGCPFVLIPCGLDGLPSGVLLRNLTKAIANTGKLRRVVVLCPSKTTSDSVINLITKELHSRQIDQVNVLQHQYAY